MADNEREPAGPDLELPSIFRRRTRTDAGTGSQPGSGPPPSRPRPSRRPRSRRRPSLPAPPSLSRLPGPAVAAAAGAVVGLLAVGLVYAGLRGCDLVRGTATCGEPGGLVLVVLVLAACAAAGAALLSLAGSPEPRSTSLLAVGATFTLCLLLLGDVLFTAWMVLLLPLVSAAAYSGGHWLASHRE